MSTFQKFSDSSIVKPRNSGHGDGPEYYVPSSELAWSIDLALALNKPLLITGEAGVGKSKAADYIAYHLLDRAEPIRFVAHSTSTATDLFYHYDSLGRFIEGQTGDKVFAADASNFITFQGLGLALLLAHDRETSIQTKKVPKTVGSLLQEDERKLAPSRSVVLIDEIDKAPRDLPNDILVEMEARGFNVPEMAWSIPAPPKDRFPILVVTSNQEKDLPDAFLRRCVYCHIEFPRDDADGNSTLETILNSRLGAKTNTFYKSALSLFRTYREAIPVKKPATAELVEWVDALLKLEVQNTDISSLQGDPTKITDRKLKEKLIGIYGALAKNETDKRELRKRFGG